MSFFGLLFIAINLVRLVQGQPLSSNISNKLRPRVRSSIGTKTLVRVHDTAERTADYIATTKSQRHESALPRALFVAWSPVLRTAKSRLTLMAER